MPAVKYNKRHEVVIEIDEIPPSMNVYSRWHWSKQRKINSHWGDRVLVQLCNNPNNRIKFLYEPVCATVIFSPPHDKRRRDLDNFCSTAHKFIADAMQHRGVIADDMQIRRITFEWGTGTPGIIYTLAPLS